MLEFIILLSVILFFLLIYFGVSFRIFREIFYRFNFKPANLVDEEDIFYRDSYAWYDEIPKDDIYIKAYDKNKLHAVYIPSHDKKTDKLALVMHGYRSKGRDMVIIAKMYSDLGFKVLLLDMRGHGLSEGKFTSMGYYESYDLKKWLHYITRNHGSNVQILLHGVSMGASTALMVTKFRESRKVKAMVLDSCFTNFRDSLKLSTNHKILRLFLPGVSLMSRFFLKFFLKDINPHKEIQTVTIPTLFIYGTKDKVVTQEMTDKLYEDIKTDTKDLLIVQDARHAKAFELEKYEYISRVISLSNKVFNIKKSDIKQFR